MFPLTKELYLASTYDALVNKSVLLLGTVITCTAHI